MRRVIAKFIRIQEDAWRDPKSRTVDSGVHATRNIRSGFLTLSGKHIPKNDNEMVHGQIAKRLGYKDSAAALNDGLIRLEGTSHFEYVSSKEAHQVVLNNLLHLDHDSEVYLDIHPRKASSSYSAKVNSIIGTPREVSQKLRVLVDKSPTRSLERHPK